MTTIFASSNLQSPAEIAMPKQRYTRSIYFGTKKGSINEVLGGGRIVVLDDGSKWSVEPEDINYVGGWLGPAPVLIRKDGAPSELYSYSMTNIWTKKTVQVRKWVGSASQPVVMPSPRNAEPEINPQLPNKLHSPKNTHLPHKLPPSSPTKKKS